jgi:hypothetical protein
MPRDITVRITKAVNGFEPERKDLGIVRLRLVRVQIIGPRVTSKAVSRATGQ